MTAQTPTPGIDAGLPQLTRRRLLMAAPALAIVPAVAPFSAQASTLEEQVKGHMTAILELLRSSAPAGYPRLDTAFIIERNGSPRLIATAFAPGEYNHGEPSAVFGEDYKWKIQC